VVSGKGELALDRISKKTQHREHGPISLIS
jgi:hypothetical protein